LSRRKNHHVRELLERGFDLCHTLIDAVEIGAHAITGTREHANVYTVTVDGAGRWRNNRRANEKSSDGIAATVAEQRDQSLLILARPKRQWRCSDPTSRQKIDGTALANEGLPLLICAQFTGTSRSLSTKSRHFATEL
jgi:hypothetical protein